MITQSCLCQILEQPVPINESLLVPRVVNGRPAQLGDVPYQIGFKTLKSRVQHIYSTFCGGVIIAPSKLLSAAHCFEAKQSACFSKSVIISGKALTRKFAVAGTLLNDEKYRADSSSGSQWRRLKMVVYPAKYKFPKHDICVVITIKPFFFNGNVAPIPIASRFIDYKGTCLVSGYGRLSPAFSKQKLQSDKLMLADLDIIPTYYCSRRHNRNMRHFICTTNQVSDTAQGDSGGPLVCYKSGDPKDLGKGVVVGVPIKVDENHLVPRVVSGFPAKLGDVPYQVGFKTLQSRPLHLYRTFCGGVIIAPNKLLSAAHCFEINKSGREKKSIIVPDYQLTRKYAVAGSLVNKQVYRTDNSEDGQWRKLKEAVYPSDFMFPQNDICIVFTIDPFTFNDYISSIPYASKYKDYKGECLTSGYGKLNKPFSEKKLKSDKLMLANLAIIPAYWCSKKHRKNMRHFICTSDKVTDVGKGDSGGPLVCAKTGDPNDKEYHLSLIT
ncbi:hypothetical protein evm_001046 [Chilo suppressalis]|nr:hypothetical protein evm_001046 [Chilo suppressalis]